MKESTRCLVVVAIAVIAAGCGDHATLAVMDVDPDEQSYPVYDSDDDLHADAGQSEDRIWYIDVEKWDSKNAIDVAEPIDSEHDPNSATAQDSTASDNSAGSMDANVPDCETEGVTCIFLNHDDIVVNGSGAIASESIVTVTSSGVFLITGTLDDGSIVVDTKDTSPVRLILDGVQAFSSTSSPLYIKDAGDVEIFLPADTSSTLTDAVSYTYPVAGQDEPNATIFSKSDLDINGSGVLTINGRFNDAINVKDGLDILGGTIIANGVDDGIRGKDNVSILGGSVSVFATNNGIKSDNDSDEGRGFIEIAAGHVKVISGGDAISAYSTVKVSGGTIELISGGGAGAAGSDTSAKGIKGLAGVQISGGDIILDSADDGIHSDNAILVTGGRCRISSGDDAVHAEETLKISGGDMDISKSYEGLESKLITIDNGTIHIVSSDDGINVAGGDGSGGWTPGGGSSSASYVLTINGGYIWMNAGGDGLDSNGNIIMNGGTVLVNGPTDNGNGPIDIGDGGSYYFKMNGGFIAAAGSSGMAVGNSASSTQYGVLANLNQSQAAGTIFHLRTASGVELLTYKPAKKYQSVFFSAPELTSGSYEIYLNGSSTGLLQDNLFTKGTYTPGTKYTTFTASTVVTRVGSSGPPH